LSSGAGYTKRVLKGEKTLRGKRKIVGIRGGHKVCNLEERKEKTDMSIEKRFVRGKKRSEIMERGGEHISVEEGEKASAKDLNQKGCGKMQAHH